MSTSWGYHEYIRGCSVHWGDTMSTSGDIMMHVGGYHEYTGGCSVSWGFQYKSKAFINLLSHMNYDIPPMY